MLWYNLGKIILVMAVPALLFVLGELKKETLRLLDLDRQWAAYDEWLAGQRRRIVVMPATRVWGCLECARRREAVTRESFETVA